MRHYNSISTTIFVSLLFGAFVASASDGAVHPEQTSSSPKTQARLVASQGPFALVEWNPADLIQRRLKIAGEYLIVDGFAFGLSGEFQSEKSEVWSHSTLALGVNAIQYFFSQSLRGPYLKGEVSLYGTRFLSQSTNAVGDYLVGIGLGLDMGYRVALGRYFTGAASYGVRRSVPDFFHFDNAQVSSAYLQNAKLWDVRVQVSLGLAL